jgi:drug/metabolite transporter (DMT)-like permease
LLILALPLLVQIRPSDISPDIIPHILFAGLIASVSGTITTTFAQRKIGATRMKVYDNLMPVSAVIFGFLLLNEPMTWLQLLGGMLTLGGVMLVRRFAKNTHVAKQTQGKLVPAKQT